MISHTHKIYLALFGVFLYHCYGFYTVQIIKKIYIIKIKKSILLETKIYYY